jgi:hypothetical protein
MPPICCTIGWESVVKRFAGTKQEDGEKKPAQWRTGLTAIIVGRRRNFRVRRRNQAALGHYLARKERGNGEEDVEISRNKRLIKWWINLLKIN